MPSVTDRSEFAPPHAKRSWGGFALAVLVHLLLIAALTWGVNWKSTDQTASFEAELWSATPQLAAPKPAVVAQPTPTPTPTPVPTPVPTPEPKPVPPPLPKPDPVPEPKVAPTVPDVDIALEQEKKRKLQQQQKEAEVRKAEKLKEQRDAERQAKKEKDIEKKKEKDRQAHEEQLKQAAQDAKEQEKKKQAVAAAAATEKARADNLKRMREQINGSGAADAKGTDEKSSGPKGNSKTYAAILQAAVRPNVVFTDEVTGNPTALIEVRVTLDGTIISQRLLTSSGNKAWDNAAMKAIVRTAVMPKDVNGRLPDTTLEIEMKPKE